MNRNTQYDIKKLRLERARQGKSITELAEKSKLDARTIMRIENGKTTPRIYTVGKIAAALGKNVEEFISGGNG